MRDHLLSLGIDPSATATGVVVLREDKDGPLTVEALEIKPKNISGAERNKFIATQLMEIIEAFEPDKIVIEGYSLNMRNSSSVIPLVELGGVIRLMMHLDGLSWFDPRASEVKKFVTGSGSAPKDVVMMHVLKRWGYEAKTNNIADAYVCAALGLAQANRLPKVTLDMRKIAGALISRMN